MKRARVWRVEGGRVRMDVWRRTVGGPGMVRRDCASREPWS